jgi:hypothetical protein
MPVGELWLCCGLEKERSCGIVCTVSGSSRTRIPRLETLTRLPPFKMIASTWDHIHFPSGFYLLTPKTIAVKTLLWQVRVNRNGRPIIAIKPSPQA